MRLIVSILTIATISFIAGLYFPWWTIAVVAFLVSFFLPQRPAAAFISGFTGVFLLWVILAAFINASNDGILAGRIGQLLKTGSSQLVLIVATGIIGGLVSGFSALCASYVRVKSSRP